MYYYRTLYYRENLKLSQYSLHVSTPMHASYVLLEFYCSATTALEANMFSTDLVFTHDDLDTLLFLGHSCLNCFYIAREWRKYLH